MAGGLIYAEPRDYLSPSRVGSDGHPDGVAHGVGEELAGNLMAKLGQGRLPGRALASPRDGVVVP